MTNTTVTKIEKIKSAIKLLEEIDDLTGNELCLNIEKSEDDEPLDCLSYWGITVMMKEHLSELEREVENKI
jgi:hypothetical protein